MATDENLQTRGCHLDSMCSNCHSHIETSNHLFLECPFVVKLWDWLGGLFSIHFNISSIDSILSACNGQWSSQVRGILAPAIIHTLNSVWFCRNLQRFENKSLSWMHVTSRIKLDFNRNRLGLPNYRCSFM
ncbi:hypothetical protein Lal_00040011 [Lupinus albus]|nr:hypothetical protein Lal_00040011 [Lupinus albus]